MSDKPVRYHVVRHTITLIHEYPVEYDDSAEFALTENGCFANTVHQLEAAVSVDNESSLCSVCAAHSAEYIGGYDTTEEAKHSGRWLIPKATPYDLSPERRREHNEGLFRKEEP